MREPSGTDTGGNRENTGSAPISPATRKRVTDMYHQCPYCLGQVQRGYGCCGVGFDTSWPVWGGGMIQEEIIISDGFGDVIVEEVGYGGGFVEEVIIDDCW